MSSLREKLAAAVASLVSGETLRADVTDAAMAAVADWLRDEAEDAHNLAARLRAAGGARTASEVRVSAIALQIRAGAITQDQSRSVP